MASAAFDFGDYLETLPPARVLAVDAMFRWLTALVTSLPPLPPCVVAGVMEAEPCPCPPMPMVSWFLPNGDWQTVGPLSHLTEPRGDACYALWCPDCLDVLALGFADFAGR
jgi:hypothetical protein